ncbi:hypothetical protein [Cohnella caldifontis]|uniref:hypothetical protein n=1 Tax=Cohnella caldifontis TaxID=3027471 RepID=UPI0023EDD3DD|nr:hypothetical protein [Cohnella sp. YIM B05605]
MRKWVHAMILHALPSGYSAKEISRILQVTYKTAWLMCHKIRHAMGHSLVKEILTGIVRIQPARYRRTIMPTAAYLTEWTKTVLGVAQFSRLGEIMQLRIVKVDDDQVHRRVVQPTPIQALIKKYVDPSAPEPKIVPQDYGPERNRNLNRAILGARTWINSMFSGGIGDKHLQAYLNQICYIFGANDHIALFHKLLNFSAITPRITGKELTQGIGDRRFDPAARRSRHARRWNAV